MWQLLAKPLLGVVADGVKGFVETKKAKQELKLTTIKATQKLKEDNQVKLHGSSAVDQMKGWKDEFNCPTTSSSFSVHALTRTCTSRFYCKVAVVLSQPTLHCNFSKFWY